MLSYLKSNKKIDYINISTLADDVVFALGDYLKNREADKDRIDLGIELCDAILRGKKIKPEKIKIEDMADYERYKIIENSSSELEMKGIKIDKLSDKTEAIKSILDDIKNGRIEVESEKVKETQRYFITISTPFWKENISLFRQRKTSRGLHVND